MDRDGPRLVRAEDDRLLLHDRDLGGRLLGIVRADLRSESVLERGDDPAARGVILRVGAGYDEEVQVEPNAIAADLDVALLHHVEQPHLDPFREIGQLVDDEDPAMGARQQPVVDRQLVGQVAALGDLDRVDLADEVRDA